MIYTGRDIIEQDIDPLDERKSKAKEMETFDDERMGNAVESFLKIDE